MLWHHTCGKSAVVDHHKQVPFRLLICKDELSVGDPDSGNLLVKGDNLEALKALLPYYADQVKCIYILILPIILVMKAGYTTMRSTALRCLTG
jgi:hypothetical protein